MNTLINQQIKVKICTGDSTSNAINVAIRCGLLERKPIEMQGRGKGRLAYVLSLVYLGDFITFYLAMLRGVDPTPIDVINQLKTKH